MRNKIEREVKGGSRQSIRRMEEESQQRKVIKRGKGINKRIKNKKNKYQRIKKDKKREEFNQDKVEEQID